MQKTLFVKALIVSGLPLLMIQATIKERMEFRQEVVNSIGADSVREQTIIGPILVIPYTEQYEERVELAKGDDKTRAVSVPARTELQRRTVPRRLLVYPNRAYRLPGRLPHRPSAACIALTGFYLIQVLHNTWRGISIGLALSVLYGALYGLLNSENNALVMGSILLFAVLAAFIVATRKVNWYQIGHGAPQQ